MKVVSLVEKGWPAARRLSIRLVRSDVSVHHLVRGSVPQAVLAILTPYEGMTITGIAASWYRWAVWVTLMRAWVLRERLIILVDHERAAAWVARWFPRLAPRVFFVQEDAAGVPTVSQTGAVVDLATLIPAEER